MRKIDEILKNEKIWDSTRYTKPGYYPMYTAWVKLPDCGTCSVVWSDREAGMEHVSVSPKKQFRMPSWDDMCVLKDIFFDDEEEVYQIHPKKSQYINFVGNCLHLWKPKGHDLNELTKVKEQTRWIPVTERLPKEGERVLVWYEYFRYGDYNCMYQTYGIGYQYEGHWSGDVSGSMAKCIAWMPLPEPWKGE